MAKYICIGNFYIPSYSVMVSLGLIVCNLSALQSRKINEQQYSNFVILEIFGGIGAIIGAKGLTILKTILREKVYINSWNMLKNIGYSYFGGLLGFFIATYCICRIKKYDSKAYARSYLFLLPLLHAFWKIGCLLGGCCVGVKYSGPFAIVYPLGVNSVSGMSVFPTPLLESIVSLVISATMIVANRREINIDFASYYLISYGLTRFFIEFLRYHSISLFISDGQFCSIICVCIGVRIYISNMRRLSNNE